ncbi:DUF1727 domain-containing protein, partial [Candidatus Gottesmanbacteria bacterium]|nr:DUF1727 domain-containing protein [Candidatus Gottesmanbacteria bacterium]
MIRLLTLLAKVISVISQLFSIGSGGTWPGEIALIIYPQILKYYLSRVQKGIIIIAGTNGKTTTSKMIQKIITDSYNGNSTKIVHNDSGANLLNGIVSAFIQQSDYIGNITVDFAILEVDESTLPLLLDYCKNKKLAIVLLNLFRDQLDRYGEVDTIATKWNNTLTEIPQGILILNA